MGIDTQIGEPPRRRPPDPIPLIMDFSFAECAEDRRWLTARFRTLPAVVSVRLDEGVANLKPGTVVFTHPGGPGRIAMWVSEPHYRRIGEIVGRAAQAVAHACEESQESVTGTILSASEAEREDVARVQLRGN